MFHEKNKKNKLKWNLFDNTILLLLLVQINENKNKLLVILLFLQFKIWLNNYISQKPQLNTSVFDLKK